MPFLISDNYFDEPAAGVAPFDYPNLMQDPYGHVPTSLPDPYKQIPEVGVGSDAGASSGTDPSSGIRLDDEGNAVECDERAISQRSTTTGASTSVSARSAASSSESSPSNDDGAEGSGALRRRAQRERKRQPLNRALNRAGTEPAESGSSWENDTASRGRKSAGKSAGSAARKPGTPGAAGTGRSGAAPQKKAGAAAARGCAVDFSRTFALAKEIARALSAFDHGCLLHEVHISSGGVDTLESLNLILKDFITTHPQTQFFKVDMSDEGVKVRLKKGGWVLSQED
jgi:hypothetical protein